MDRRRFLGTLATGLVTAGCAVPRRSPSLVPASPPTVTPEHELTPLSRFFVTAITSAPPVIDVATGRLIIDGVVERPYSIGYEDLAHLPQMAQRTVLQCVGGARGTAQWEGVTLRRVLESAGLGPRARKVIFYAPDGYESSIPIQTAMRPDSLLALRMNDEPLRAFHGYPVRLVLPGLYGYKQVKWITRIEIVEHDHRGYWEQRGYADDGTIRS